MNALILWIAQGFGAGRIPLAPGTFGSMVGLLWFALLLFTKSLWIFSLATLCGIALSIWVCERAEKILKHSDPPSVVLDEICAIPLCFVAPTAMHLQRFSEWPSAGFFFSSQGYAQAIAVFVLFRAFDVVKPWPLRGSQKLPGGFGVVIDDMLAACYVNIVMLAILLLKIL